VTDQASSPRPLDSASGDESQSDADRLTTDQPDAATIDSRPASPLVILSGAFLIVGIGLFGVRWTARRLSGI
jgi:hypothetical protein